jgi:ABC-type uncharacterized transport system fused permease/ATPase subunit
MTDAEMERLKKDYEKLKKSYKSLLEIVSKLNSYSNSLIDTILMEKVGMPKPAVGTRGDIVLKRFNSTRMSFLELHSKISKLRFDI